MKLVLITIGLMVFAFAGIAVKLLLKKDGKFAGTCASNNPVLREEGVSCSICGAKPEEQCQRED
ncbi:MAG: membrane or secreted protein [Flavobacteriales bacterium]|nr:membrane or secreted protein [Flavobacteriales bacterium]